MARICLVSCASTKGSGKAKAKDLYISSLFQFAKAVAERDYDRWFILSALHGLLDPEKKIDPYNETLKKIDPSGRELWAKKVEKDLLTHLKSQDSVTFFAGDTYQENLLPALKERGIECKRPLRGLGLGQQIHVLKVLAENPERVADIDRFYSLIDRLRKAQGSVLLSTVEGASQMPSKGVYFFFQDDERRLLEKSTLRCVRVGTHAVSKNSASTLWNRLRTHRGTNKLAGNHRSSIFRLHVGAAMIARKDFENPPRSWGIGQDASSEIRLLEQKIENSVSKYIAAMQILWVGIHDEPGPTSDRSFIEKNSIGLLAGPAGPFDLPSRKWLGLGSPHKAIRKSGLWNVNYVDFQYDHRFLDVLETYVNATVGLTKFPEKSIAPENWYEKRELSQIPLFNI